MISLYPKISGNFSSLIFYVSRLLFFFFFTSWVFFTSVLMVFHWSLSDSKGPQVFRALLSILAVLNNAVVWIISTRLPTSKSSSSFSNPLDTEPNAPTTIGIIVTFMFSRFFNSLARSRFLSFSLYFSFTLWSAGTAKSTILQVLWVFFPVDYYKVCSSDRDLVILLYVKVP